MNIPCDQRGSVAASYLKGTKHQFYEDSFRMLPKDVPLVKNKYRGELFAVFDGIGSAPEGRHAAQVLADSLVNFYKFDEKYNNNWNGLTKLLFETNIAIYEWGFMPGTDKPVGGCAGTVLWILGETLFVFHVGDTMALLIRDGKMSQLTKIHQTDDGAIFEYFGIGKSLKIDVNQYEIEESDRILLISDGITKSFLPIEASEIVENHMDICMAVTDLVRQAQIKGSTDDITAMLIQIDEIWE